MKKRILSTTQRRSLSILVLLPLLLLSCQRSKKASEPIVSLTELGSPNAPVKLRGLIGAWNTVATTNERAKEYYLRKITEWVDENPDVYIEIETIPGGQTPQAMTKLLTAAVSHNAPDFANIDSQWLGNFYEADVLSLIDPLLREDEREQFFDFTKSVTTRNGQQYALWPETAVMLYYYNTNFVSEPAQVWGDILALGERLKSQGEAVIPFLMPGRGAAAAHTLLPYFWGEGGTLFDSHNSYRPHFNRGVNRVALINTLQFYQRMRQTGTIAPQMVSYEHTELQTEASNNNVASMVAGSWIYSSLDPAVWRYNSIPMREQSRLSNTSGGWTFAFFSRDEKKLETSLNFIRHLYSDRDSMAERLPLQGYIPTRKDVFATEAFSGGFYKKIYHELEIARARPATSLYPVVEGLLEESIGKIMSGDQDIEKLVGQIYEKVEREYETR